MCVRVCFPAVISPAHPIDELLYFSKFDIYFRSLYFSIYWSALTDSLVSSKIKAFLPYHCYYCSSLCFSLYICYTVNTFFSYYSPFLIHISFFSVKIRQLWITSSSRDEHSCNLLTFATKNIHSWMDKHLGVIHRWTW